MLFCNIQTLFEFGAEEKAPLTVITAPLIELTSFVSTEPSDKITLNFGLLLVSKSVDPTSSTVTEVTVADLILPPLLTPALTGSLTSIT